MRDDAIGSSPTRPLPTSGAAIRKVFARFIALCRTLGLLTRASVAIDGNKFKAVNNRDKKLHARQDGVSDGTDRGERRSYIARSDYQCYVGDRDFLVLPPLRR